MKRLIFGIFAHPDDEAFGPAGTLYLATQTGCEVHLICATNGEAGMNPDKVDNLSQLRNEEWLTAGKLLGASSQICLDYPDGGLNNNLYLELAGKILGRIDQIITEHNEPLEVELMTLDPNGLTGHLDHVAIAAATTFAYLKLRTSPPAHITLGRLKYFCLSDTIVSEPNLDWLYMPKGRSAAEVDEIVDVGDVFEQKRAIMNAHVSQRADAAHLITSFGDALKQEAFFYYKD